MKQIGATGEQAVTALAETLAATLPVGPHFVFLTNLGEMSAPEMSVLAFGSNARCGTPTSHIVCPAAMTTSLDLRGVWVTIYVAPAAHLAPLMTTVDLAAWLGCLTVGAPVVLAWRDACEPPRSISSSNASLFNAVLMRIAADMNALDVGTCWDNAGATLAGAARTLLDAADQLPLVDHGQLLRASRLPLIQTMC